MLLVSFPFLLFRNALFIYELQDFKARTIFEKSLKMMVFKILIETKQNLTNTLCASKEKFFFFRDILNFFKTPYLFKSCNLLNQDDF